MAIFTVNTLADENDGIATGGVSLRDAIAAANATTEADTIVFDASVFTTGSETILLTNGELYINSDIVIEGDVDNNTATAITIDAGGQSRVLQVTSNSTDSTLDNLVFANGSLAGNGGGQGEAALGAGIYNAGGLTVTNSTFDGNGAAAGGGGAYSAGGGGGFTGVPGSIGGNGGAGYFPRGYGNSSSGGDGGDGNPSRYAGEGGSGGPDSSGGAGGVYFDFYTYRGGNGGAGGTAAGAGAGGGAGGAAYIGNAERGGDAAGAIFNARFASLTILNTTFSDNLALGGGGAGGNGFARDGADGGDAASSIFNYSLNPVLIDQSSYDSATGVSNLFAAGQGGYGGEYLGYYSYFGDRGETGAQGSILGDVNIIGGGTIFSVAPRNRRRVRRGRRSGRQPVCRHHRYALWRYERDRHGRSKHSQRHDQRSRLRESHTLCGYRDIQSGRWRQGRRRAHRRGCRSGVG